MSTTPTVGLLGTYSVPLADVISVRGTAQVEIPTSQIPALLTTIARTAYPLLTYVLPDQSSELTPTLSPAAITAPPPPPVTIPSVSTPSLGGTTMTPSLGGTTTATAGAGGILAGGLSGGGMTGSG